MRLSWVFAVTVLLFLATGARCKRKFDGDFEFAEEMTTDKQRYTIVRFPEESGAVVDLVPASWLQEKKNTFFCSYPDPNEYCHLNDWLAQLKEPESHWELYVVEVISYAKSLNQGRRRLNRAMTLSDDVESEARGRKCKLNPVIKNQTVLERELYNMRPMTTSECSSKQKATTTLSSMKDKLGSTGSIRTQSPSLLSAPDITTELCLHFDKKLDDALKEIKKEITAAKRSILYDIEKKMEQLQASIVINTAGAKEAGNMMHEIEKNFQMFPLNTLQEFLSLEEDIKTQEEKKEALDDTRIMKVGDKKKWIHDPNSELCPPLNCKKKEICLLEDTFTAVCVSKKEIHKNGDIIIPKSRVMAQRRMKAESSVDSEDDDAFFDSEDDDEDQDESKCQECPVVKPTFLCGSDNRTYSSPCRLEYHNCIHHTSVRTACKGFCPCKTSESQSVMKKAQMVRQKALMRKMARNRDITLTPRHLNYENHHYQYLKYTKRGKGAANGLKYDDKHLMTNEVMDKSSSPIKSGYNSQSSRNTDCPASSKPAMANRLLDWFSVVMADSKHRLPHPKSKANFSTGCHIEVRWMFGHLDNDNDGDLSRSELYGLEHDQNEPCLKPFLDGCDTNRNGFVSGPEWCGCFSNAQRPCAAVRDRYSPDVAPACDSRGYYRSTQCHRGLGLCWCVDPHGVEFAGTRTLGAKPDCDTIVNKISSSGLKTNSVDLDDDEDAGTDSPQDLEGSADQPLDF